MATQATAIHIAVQFVLILSGTSALFDLEVSHHHRKTGDIASACRVGGIVKLAFIGNIEILAAWQGARWWCWRRLGLALSHLALAVDQLNMITICVPRIAGWFTKRLTQDRDLKMVIFNQNFQELDSYTFPAATDTLSFAASFEDSPADCLNVVF